MHAAVVMIVVATTIVVLVAIVTAFGVMAMVAAGPAVARPGVTVMAAVTTMVRRLRSRHSDQRRRDIGTGNTSAQRYQQTATTINRVGLLVTHTQSPCHGSW
ncbi:hypothetical protein D5687_06950 [Guyparkeria sp. SCN-R1]|nr:hypothetical protein D5687_06950 [Guyparkeria sp. SCN-R1]